MLDPRQRFSSRVENYVKYRPGYPPEVLGTLQQECGLTSTSRIADIGSGTGILSAMFLQNGNTVYGVEPNREMREAGERLLSGYGNFHSIAAAAEDTTLPAGSVDFVTAGQAFHWFKRNEAHAEFARILRPEGWVALVWNARQGDTTTFLRAYEGLLRQYGTDYDQAKHRDVDDYNLEKFYGGSGPQVKVFANRQLFDYEGLQGRVLSSSYTPQSGHPNYEPMLNALKEIFSRHQEEGKVAFEYNTMLYYGHLSA